MDFTREPVLEAVITPREGYRLVVRSSKSAAQEEYFVDAVEVVSFGSATFFRCLERPKAFLVPINDYEVLEVREARLVLKNVGMERSIKIAGGREAALRPAREPVREEVEAAPEEEQPAEGRVEKKRDRRRQYRRRRGRDEKDTELSEEKVEIPAPITDIEGKEMPGTMPVTTSVLSSLLPPPPALIRDTISKYKENALFKDVFIQPEEELKEEESIAEEYQPHEKVHELLEEEEPVISPEAPEKSFPPSLEEEEDIYRMRLGEEVPYEPEPEADRAPEFFREKEEKAEEERENESIEK